VLLFLPLLLPSLLLLLLLLLRPHLYIVPNFFRRMLDVHGPLPLMLLLLTLLLLAPFPSSTPRCRCCCCLPTRTFSFNYISPVRSPQTPSGRCRTCLGRTRRASSACPP
jgi:hypothetical protein